ncbi:TniQ family protein [Cytobacillus praedii]|uniref:TniQ family protein n=1 Tax=Cytobacillus praedii TaxID=1742358 RepID=UPI003AF9AB22
MDINETFLQDYNQVQSSTLYNIEPIGIRTIFCESLTSYFVRLAEVHCLNLGVLLNKIVSPVLKKDYVLRSSEFGGNRFFDGARTFNGIDKNSLDLVNALGYLTKRKDLLQLTLKKWDRVLTNRELLKKSLSWCPLCLKEFYMNYNFEYYPLLWFIKPVKSCLIHKTILIDTCQSCKNKVPILHRESVNGLCPYCKSKLSLAIPTFIEKINLDKEIYIHDNIGKLISGSINTTETELVRNIISDGLNNLARKYKDSHQKSLMKVLGIPKSTFYSWLRGESIPTIKTLLDICYSVGISLSDLITIENIQPSLVIETSYKTNKLERRKLDYSLIENTLKTYFMLEVPMSMAAIAQDIGISKRMLYKNLPELCKTLSKKHQESLNFKSNQRKMTIQGIIKLSVSELLEREIPPTQKNIEKHLCANSLLRENFAKEYLNNLLNNLK